MKKLQGISSDAKQSFSFMLDDGSQIDFNLSFSGGQVGWFLTFKYGNVIVDTPLRLTVCPNIIREYKNILPFGIGLSTLDGEEPMVYTDFANGYASLYVLDKEDVGYVEETVYAKTV